MPLVRRRIVAREQRGGAAAPRTRRSPIMSRVAARGFRLNVNVLGEAILSDAEADERMGWSASASPDPT